MLLNACFWQRIILTKFLLFLTLQLFTQGLTTASMRGRVINEQGKGLNSAVVKAEHTPTGATYEVVTDFDGYYQILGMRIGGPYVVSFSYAELITSLSFDEFTQYNVFLTAGQGFQINVSMGETESERLGQAVDNFTSRIFNQSRTGFETFIDQSTIKNLPTISRSINDFTRVNPISFNSESSDGFISSIAGQNVRYNTLLIDGAITTDQYGFTGSGTDGGQTGANPISIDALEQIKIQATPFNVRLGGFTGGVINMITRSGTNELEGSAYFYNRNEKLTGKTPDNRLDTEDRQRLADFSSSTYGFRVGGPIIRNKLFYFANAEFQRDETPYFFDFSDYQGDASLDDLGDLENKLDDFDYDPETFTRNTSTLNRNFFLLKLDWNINNNNTLSARHFYNDIENFDTRTSSPYRIGYSNGSEFYSSSTHNTTLQLNSILSSTTSNNLRVGIKFVRDDRDVFGKEFPYIEIRDGDGRIELGGEQFSSANFLNQDVFTLSNDFQISLGKHNLTVGTQNEFTIFENLFIPYNYGSYDFDSLDDFLNDAPSSTFIRYYSQADNVVGDESNATAKYRYIQLGLYVQDDIQISPEFKLTAGLRFDLPIFPRNLSANEQFEEQTIPLIEDFYDEDLLEGASVGVPIKSSINISPRLGFNWDVGGNKQTQIRGGAGVFLGRQPGALIGNTYLNSGFNTASFLAFGDVIFNPDIDEQSPGDIDPDNPVLSGQIDLFSTEYKLPKSLKVNLAADQKMPGGVIGSAEIIYTKTLQNLFMRSLNIKPSVANFTNTGDERPIFDFRDEIDPTYTGVYLATNTQKGYAVNLLLSLTKPFSNGLTGSIAYAYGDAFSINDGRSIQHRSNWRYQINARDGKNEEGDLKRSRYALGHRIFSAFSYRREYGGLGATTFTLIFEGRSGDTFTYTVDHSGTRFISDNGFSDSEPIYIPINQDDIILEEKDGFTVDEQWRILDDYIEDHPELDYHRGQYAPINGSRLPFKGIFDLKVSQEFFIDLANGKRNTFEITLDVFNLNNLIGNAFRRDWGKFYGNDFGDLNLLRFEAFEDDDTTPIYSVDDQVLAREEVWEDELVDEGSFRSSRWQMQLGFRYTFGN